MTNSAQTHLLEVSEKFINFYGIEITNLVYNIDYYIRYYQETELQKRELQSAYDGYVNNEVGCGIENLLSTVLKSTDPECRSVQAVNEDMFDFSLLKKFISDLAVVSALNEPERIRVREETRAKYAFCQEDEEHNLINEN